MDADALRGLMAANRRLSAQCDLREAKIREAATTHAAAVEDRLADMKPGAVVADDRLAHSYRDLIGQRGTLAMLNAN